MDEPGMEQTLDRLADMAGQVDVLLLDVGGVLYVDPWEHLLLAEDTGVAAQLGLPPDRLAVVGRSLWPRYATAPAEESAWWDAVAAALDVEIDPVVRARAEAALRPTPWADEVLAAGMRASAIGTITDNTSFWYARQREALDLGQVVAPALEFVSCLVGVRKRDRPGLLDHAAASVDPSRTLVVDDRQHNLDVAAVLGFRTLRLGRPADG